MTLLFSDPIFLKHDTGPHHPERIGRLQAILARLEQTGLAAKCVHGTISPLAEGDVTRVHAPSVLAAVHDAIGMGGAHVDPDTVVCPHSLDAALAAAGAACAAVNAVLTGDDPTALCLVRPPGHHATPTKSMGFCLFNTIALAARRAIDFHQLNRVMIVDWDVHHGNGTQDIFYSDANVFFFSIHRFGRGFYPGTGAAGETGTGRGLGFTKNVPLPFGISRPEFIDAFTSALEECAGKMRPELVMVSAGFDAHRLDPIGSLGLESEDYRTLTERVLEVAKVHAQGRVVSCLEGGYNLNALAESVQIHLESLLSMSR